MATINISEAKANLSKLADQAAAGEDVIITRHGKPVARLTALEAIPQKRRLGGLRGKMHFLRRPVAGRPARHVRGEGAWIGSVS
jgi:prevent-host-death family protein